MKSFTVTFRDHHTVNYKASSLQEVFNFFDIVNVLSVVDNDQFEDNSFLHNVVYFAGDVL